MSDFAATVLAWYDRDGRHDLPWQHPRSPYRVWLAEVMLQQTQVGTVVPYFRRFVAALPEVPALAAADLDTVMALWSGLGYYARARNLHRSARICMAEHGGELPAEFDALAALPGIGRSTAGAILAQAHGQRWPILDGNVKRLLCRYHGIAGWPGERVVEKRLWELAETLLPDRRLADYTQAQMDLGATVCTRADPACVLCPLQQDCTARREGRIAELPQPRPGKPLPQRHTLMLVAIDPNGRLLLVRRPPAGIWAGLWSLPEADHHDAARAWLDGHLRADYDHGQPLAEFDHVFSHYRLRIQPLLWRGVEPRPAVGDNPDLRWVSPTELTRLGLPTPVRRLLEGLSELARDRTPQNRPA